MPFGFSDGQDKPVMTQNARRREVLFESHTLGQLGVKWSRHVGMRIDSTNGWIGLLLEANSQWKFTPQTAFHRLLHRADATAPRRCTAPGDGSATTARAPHA